MSPEYLAALRANAQPHNPQPLTKFVNGKLTLVDNSPQQASQKQRGKGGFLTSLISEGGAGAGAAIGSFLGPVGTIAGAGIGGFLGRLGENKVRDNRYGLSQALQEGATSAVFSGAGEGLKALKGAKAAKGLVAGLGGTDEAAQLVKGAGRTAAPGILERKGLDKVSQAGGYFAKDNVPGIGKISTNEVNKYYDVLKKLKIKPNDAGDLEKIVTDRLGKTGNIISNQLSSANKTLSKTEVSSFADDLLAKVRNTPGLTPEAKKFATEQTSLMKTQVKDLRGIHDFRVKLDDAINWNANPDSAVAAQQGAAKVLRTGIRDKLNNEVKGLAGTNNLYHDLTDIQKLTLRAAGRVGAEGTSGGGSLTARVLSSPTANTIRGKVGGVMKEAGQYTAGTGGALTKGTNQFIRQSPASLTSAIGGAMGGQPDQTMQSDIMQTNPDGTYQQAAPGQVNNTFNINDPTAINAPQGGNMQTQQPQSQYSLQQALADYQRAPTKQAQQQVMDYYDFVSKAEAAQAKSQGNANGLPSNVGKVSASSYQLAQQGLRGLSELAQIIQKDPGVINRTATPGRGLPVVGGFIGNKSGTTEFDTAGFAAVSSLLRAQSGAAVPDSEVRAYMRHYLPRAGDSPQAIQKKLLQLQYDFQTVMQGGGSNQLSDVLNQQGAQ